MLASLGPQMKRARTLSERGDLGSQQELKKLTTEIREQLTVQKAGATPEVQQRIEGFERTLDLLVAKKVTGEDELASRDIGFGGVQTGGAGGGQLGIGGLAVFEMQKAPPAASKIQINRPQLRAIKDANRVEASGEAVAAFAAPLLSDHILSFNYDSQVFALDFLKELKSQREADPTVEPVKVFREHNPRAKDLLQEWGGSHCVGLSLDFADRLRDLGIQAEIGAAEIPGSAAPFGHAFVMVPFQNPDERADRGVVLMDPGLNLADPIIVRPDKPGVLEMGEGDAAQKWTFSLDEATGKIDVKRELKKGTEESTWNAQAWDNPDDALSVLSSSGSKLKQVARDERGQVVAASVIDFKRRQVSLRAGDEQTRIPFDELNEKLDLAASPALAELLGFDSPVQLSDRIRMLVDNEDVLNQTREVVDMGVETT